MTVFKPDVQIGDDTLRNLSDCSTALDVGDVTFDLTDVTFMTGQAMGFLVAIDRATKNKESSLFVIPPRCQNVPDALDRMYINKLLRFV